MQSPPRILYVDDHEDTCQMVRLLFSSHGVEVCCVDSAADAALKMKSAHFDLMILDVWLPNLDGLEFCRQVRRSESRIPIIFYSGAAYDADISRGLAAGANAYLVKPDIDGLTQAVLRVIGQRSTADMTLVNPNKQRGSAPSPRSRGFETLRAASD